MGLDGSDTIAMSTPLLFIMKSEINEGENTQIGLWQYSKSKMNCIRKFRGGDSISKYQSMDSRFRSCAKGQDKNPTDLNQDRLL